MKGISANLREVRKRLGLTQAGMAAKVGVAPRSYQDYERGVSIPSVETLCKVAKLGRVSLDWLVGEESLSPLLSPEVVILTPEEARERFKGMRVENYIPVPLVADRAAAFDPAFVSESDIEGYAVIYKAWLRPNGKYSCVRIKGGSMLPVLAEGDIVAVNHARTDPEDLHRKMVALSLEEEGVTIKYLQVEPDRRHLVVYAENRAEWEPRFLELDQLPIVGAVEWAWRRFE